MKTDLLKNFLSKKVEVVVKRPTKQQSPINTDGVIDLRPEEDQSNPVYVDSSYAETSDGVQIEVFEMPEPILHNGKSKRKTTSGPISSNYMRSRHKERIVLS